jgi:type VI secretion system secreted protein VgrG
MARLSNIRITIDGEEINGFQNLNLVQDMYGIDLLQISFRLETLEQPNTFITERSKNFIGKTVTIRSEIQEQGESETQDGFSFRGIVTGIQSQKTGSRSGDIITITGNSPDIILNGKPNCRTFTEKSLEEIINEVLQPYPQNLLSPNISPRYTEPLSYIVQYNESDYDFIHRIARKFGEWFFYDGAELYFGELPETDNLDLTLGVDIDSFDFSLQTNPSNFKIRHVENTFTDERYDYESGSHNVEQQTNEIGRHIYQQSGNLFSEQSVRSHSHLNISHQNVQQGMNNAGFLEETSDLLKMTATSGSGNNKRIKIGQVVTVNYPGEGESSGQSYGRYRLTSIVHSCDNIFNYNNSFSAMPADCETPENVNINAVIKSKPFRAYVIDNADPENLGRVKLDFAWRSGQEDRTPWVLCASHYTTENGGSFFVPEIYSEVLVDFVDGDIDQPYVTGTFFSSDVRPFYPDNEWASDAANIKAIRTRSGHTIEFHDSDGGEKIRIYDAENKNEIILDSANDELKITATGTLKIEANDIEIKAENGLKIEAGQSLEQKANQISSEAQSDLKSTGTNVEIKANASLKAEGSASTEVTSSGTMTVRGSVVQIN